MATKKKATAVETPVEKVETKSEEVKEAPKKRAPKEYVGKVCNCKMLNVRSEASTKSEIIGVISEGEVYEVNKKACVEGWVAIKMYQEGFDQPLEGFCMAQYIEVSEKKGE